VKKTSSIIGRIDWTVINRLTRRQVRNREVHCPPISLFRWWARRPQALARAILDASGLGKNDVVSDPFSGGGTVTLEAAVRGHRVYAQDLNPWPVWGLQVALDRVEPKPLQEAIDSFWVEFRKAVDTCYSAPCSLHGKGETLNTFWVRECACPHCKQKVYLYPYSLLTVASRREKEKAGFYGCSACGKVTKGGLINRVSCHHCKRHLSNPRHPLLAKRRVSCPHCNTTISDQKTWRMKPVWKPVLVQRSCDSKSGKVTHFEIPSRAEVIAASMQLDVPRLLRRSIPNGRETRVLHRSGFRCWADLYPPRQLRVLLTAARLARELDVDDRVRQRIQLAIAGAAEMAGYLCRWDRFHPKAFEALANHRYAVLGLAIESNLAADQGRGTLRRRLAASVKAAGWTQRYLWKGKGVEDPRLADRDVIHTIVAGSSAKQRLSSGSVSLVITDPPYYDAVQYGELSALFLAWAKVVTGKQRAWQPNLRNEAVPNGVRRTGTAHYQKQISSILLETSRTMRSNARLVLTFHSTDFRGWAALAAALHKARLCVVALAVAHSENEVDHPKHNRNGFFKDLVIECRKGKKPLKPPDVFTVARADDERELLSAGLTVAEGGNACYQEMVRQFRTLTTRLKCRRISVPKTETDLRPCKNQNSKRVESRS